MIALVANVDERDLILRFNPMVHRSVLNNFIYWHPFPAKRHEVISFLYDEIGGTDEEIDIYFTSLIKEKIIRTNGNTVIPLDLGKELAISHILARFPKGLSWEDIAIKVNRTGICRTKLSLERPDPNLSFSSYVYLSGQHTYSHIRFFPIGKVQIEFVLKVLIPALFLE